MAKKRVDKKFSLKNEYSKSWNYLKESKKFIYILIWIFVIFTLIGFFVPAPETVQQQIVKFLQDILDQVKDLSQFGMIKFIFLNNLQSSFFGLILGIFLGIFPVVVAIVNGYLLGFVGNMTVNANGIWSLWRILPHGVFELPAVFISLGLGLKLGSFLWRGDKKKSFKNYFWNSIRVFVLVVIPLLIIAAIIEGSLMFLLK